jgi:hypothetical protein
MNNAIQTQNTFIPSGTVLSTGVLTSAVAITIPKRANGVLLSAEVGNVRYAFYNQVPTNSVGLLLTPAQGTIRLDMPEGTKFSVIEAVNLANAIVQYQFVSTL